MTQDSAPARPMINAAGRVLLRLLIASYFLAVALQIIPGTDLGILFASILPAPFDSALAAGLVFVLAFLIMSGHSIRLAALVMALMTFYASYLAMLSLGVGDELGAFWRDLALIAALLLTYSDGEARARPRPRQPRGPVTPRRPSVLTMARRPLRSLTGLALAGETARAQPARVLSDEATVFALRRRRYGAAALAPLADPREEVDNIFAEDAAPTA